MAKKKTSSARVAVAPVVAAPEGRRTPRQARARVTVDAILEAAAQVLRETGVERTSTNLIAQVAGVSIGTLYQYFSDKQAIIAALQARIDEALLEAMAHQVAQREQHDLRSMTRAVVQSCIDVFERDPELVRALLEGDALDDQAGVPETIRLVAVGLEPFREQLAVGDVEVAAFFVVQAVNAAMLQSERTLKLPSKRVVDECVRLAVGYLTTHI